MDFWQTVGGQRFQAQLIHQLTRLADGIETQNGLYEKLLEGTPATQQLARNYYGQEVAPVCPEPAPADLAYYGQEVAPVCPEPAPADLAYYESDCEKCQGECQPFIAKPTWLHDEDGNDVLKHCRCTCTCHIENLEKETTV